jgi:hypothetical protein
MTHWLVPRGVNPLYLLVVGCSGDTPGILIACVDVVDFFGGSSGT